jgi:hypothetical protein
VLEEAISGVSPQKITDQRPQFLVIREGFWVPVRIGVQADSRYPETVLPPSNGSIGPEGENGAFVRQMSCREKKPQIARSQKGSDGGTAHPVTVDDGVPYGHEVFRLWIPTNGIPARKRKELTPLGQWTERVSVAREFLGARLGSHKQGGVVVDPAFWI